MVFDLREDPSDITHNFQLFFVYLVLRGTESVVDRLSEPADGGVFRQKIFFKNL